MTRATAGLRKALGILMALGTLPLFAWGMDRGSMHVEGDSYLFSYGFWVGAIPLWVTLALLVIATNRVLWSSLIVTALLGCLYVTNMLKLRYLASPLELTDYYFIRDMDWGSAQLFLRYIDLGVALASIVLLMAVLAVAWRFESPLTKRYRPLVRMSGLATVGLIGYLLTLGPAGASIYSDQRLAVLPFDTAATQFRTGLISDLIQAEHAMAGVFNEPVHPNAVSDLMAHIGKRPLETASADAARPDVIVIQSESFFDPSLIRQVGDTHALLPRVHEAMEQGTGGEMIVPTFGGGTIRTEFEVLTGIPLAAYPKVKFPYLQLSQSRMPGLARAFADAGYQTVAVHGNGGGFWNRNSALRSMGFSTFITANEFASRAYHDGWYLSDHAMTDEIIGRLDHAKAPTFVFAISIEAHGPYRHTPVKDEIRTAQLPSPESFSEDASEEYRRYAYHISEADKEFGRLWDYLKSRHRPFVLVFYGDHLPGFQYVYRESSFRNGLPANMQHVPWVAVGSGIGKSDIKGLYAWMLSDEVLRFAGVKDTTYLALVGAAGERVLKEPEGSADSQAMLDGLYSAARLDLNGDLDSIDWVGSHAD